MASAARGILWRLPNRSPCKCAGASRRAVSGFFSQIAASASRTAGASTRRPTITECGEGIGFQCGEPLLSVLAVFPAALVLGMNRCRRLAECRNASRLAPLCNRINPRFDLRAHVCAPALAPASAEPCSRCPSQCPAAARLSGRGPSSFCRRASDQQEQSVAVAIAPRLFCSLHGGCR